MLQHPTLQKLYDLNSEALQQFVGWWLESTDEERIEEICERVWIAVAQTKEGYMPEEATFSGWLRAIARTSSPSLASL